MEINKIYCGDSLEVLKTFESESIDTIITSPPYWGLRDYGVEGQLGLEKTPEEYVAKLVEIFREVKRVLKKEGNCWLNLGDTYSAARWSSGVGQPMNKMKDTHRAGEYTENRQSNLPDKNLVGIPWRVAFALQADGWYLRQDIIWAKPNPMPESVTDRFTKSHEYIFLLTKNAKYYFDSAAIAEPAIRAGDIPKGGALYREKIDKKMMVFRNADKPVAETRNKRSVWTITTKPYKEAHFATFPADLILPMVKAGCPEFVCKKCGKTKKRIYQTNNPKGITGRNGKPMVNKGIVDTYNGKQRIEPGHNSTVYSSAKFIGYTKCNCNVGFVSGIVLDPFMGSGTTAYVARSLGRNYVGIELNKSYIALANKRLAQQTLL